MAMSDCVKCWETPCTCGWDYRNWKRKDLIKMRDMFQQLIDGTHMYSEGAKNTEQQVQADFVQGHKHKGDT
jgi:hypothetical protein